MSAVGHDPPWVQVLRRSDGRLRVALPAPQPDPAQLEQAVRAAPGVQTAALSRQTGNLLVTFDPRSADERQVLEAVAAALVLAGETPPAAASPLAAEPPAAALVRPSDGILVRDLEAPAGWRAAEGRCLIPTSRPQCTRAILDFAAYPEWQRYVTRVDVLERDRQGRGAVVRTEGRVGEQTIVHVMRYRYPSPTRITWEQLEGELEAMRGEWRFRSAGRLGTRASCRLEIRPGRRLRLLLRGPLFDQARDALFAHTLGELRRRVEGAARPPVA